jgi:hypothetical protein
MPPYEGSETGLNRKKDPSVSWYRIGEEIYDDGGDQDSIHFSLALKDGKVDEIENMKELNPVEVDAGLYKVDPKNRSLTLFYYSSTLGISIEDSARQRSVEVFQAQTPEYTVVSE